MQEIKLVVLDMAGTTVKDTDEVLRCFIEAARASGLKASEDDIRAMMGRRKRDVFAELASRQAAPAEAKHLTDEAYGRFRNILEEHYRTGPVEPVEGTARLFAELRRRGTVVALTTGFYRGVTDIILDRLGWLEGLDERRMNTGPSPIDLSLCSDDVPEGRPAPYMIHEAMRRLRILDVHTVAKAGDTAADLWAGHNAGCGLNVGVLSGSAGRAVLEECPHTHIVESAVDILDLLY